jgi:hypothetical protein
MREKKLLPKDMLHCQSPAANELVSRLQAPPTKRAETRFQGWWDPEEDAVVEGKVYVRCSSGSECNKQFHLLSSLELQIKFKFELHPAKL